MRSGTAPKHNESGDLWLLIIYDLWSLKDAVVAFSILSMRRTENGFIDCQPSNRWTLISIWRRNFIN